MTTRSPACTLERYCSGRSNSTTRSLISGIVINTCFLRTSIPTLTSTLPQRWSISPYIITPSAGEVSVIIGIYERYFSRSCLAFFSLSSRFVRFLSFCIADEFVSTMTFSRFSLDCSSLLESSVILSCWSYLLKTLRSCIVVFNSVSPFSTSL